MNLRMTNQHYAQRPQCFEFPRNDVVILSDISGLIFQSRTTEERLLPFLNALLLFTKYQNSQTVGEVYDALRSNEKWRCRMKEGLVVTYCFFFFNRTENIKIYKDG